MISLKTTVRKHSLALILFFIGFIIAYCSGYRYYLLMHFIFSCYGFYYAIKAKTRGYISSQIAIFIMLTIFMLTGFFMMMFFEFAFMIGLLHSYENIDTSPTYATNTNIIRTNQNNNEINNQTDNQIISDVKSYCDNCNNEFSPTDQFCSQCGKERVFVTTNNFNPIYKLRDDQLVEQFIMKKMMDNSNGSNFVSKKYIKKKALLASIFTILLFISISLVFFHFPLTTYVLSLIILIGYLVLYSKYNYTSYIKRIVVSRPGEKITNIIMNENNNSTKDNSKLIMLVSCIFAIVLSLIIFRNPIILYEEKDNGYAVRYYIYGLTNFTTAEIPEKHNGKDVISLRGNAFSNMYLLKEVKLPDTIKEIRGQAFKNDIFLTTVNIPNNLEYLGGGSFYNCKSLEKIELPDTLTYLGGESFKNSGIESIKLSENITEIRGNTFENCTSLKSINIPDKVTRIGGHAFYNTGLNEVGISQNSNLQEIGSSAFRQCSNLQTITLPPNVTVNSRAFKESPTEIKYYGVYGY